MENTEIELYALTEEISIEELPEANALSTAFTASTGSTASCPGSSAATVGCASSVG